MSQTKSVTLYGLTNDVEGSYGGGGTLDAATDGIQLAEETLGTVKYLNDGERAAPPGSTSASQKANEPSGAYVDDLEPSTEIRGAGAAYSSSAKPETHTWWSISGHTATLDATPGAEKYTYTPHALTTTPISGVLNAYARGQLWPLTGAYASVGFVLEAGGYGIMTAALSAIVGSPSDVALPAITYSSVLPPKVEGMALTIGNYTGGIIRRVQFQQGRAIVPRAGDGNAAAGAHPGFAVGRMDATLEVLVEADSFHGTTPYHAAAAIDPFKMYETAQVVAVSFNLGVVGTGYNSMQFTASQAQLSGPPADDADGPTALWRLSFKLRPSTPILQDMYSVVFPK